MKSIEISVTQEEKTIVSRLANGEKADNIRRELKIAQGTFAMQLLAMRSKYNVKNTTQLVALFIRENIIK
jgi:DNA-binding CsgD family transcriptional regulator